jgi:hypothetical protein
MCTIEYRAYDVFKKMIGVRGYIGVKNYCKALLFVKNVFQNFEPFFWELSFKVANMTLKIFLRKI